jgi:ATP-dependent DNA ligase
MLARPSRGLPDDDGGFAFEPKWDGFRVIAFVDGDEVDLRSRNDRPLNRYFPELAFPHGRYVLDGEIIVRDADGGIAFGALQQRIHPAASRVERMSVETPASVVAFDLLALADEVLLERSSKVSCRRPRSSSARRCGLPPRRRPGCTSTRA